MAGRIRTVKPEWLDDEKIALASLEARVMSIGLLCLADDYGRGRAHLSMLAARIFPAKDADGLIASVQRCGEAAKELERLGYVVFYEVEGQRYFAIRNWAKHQRVQHPGKPMVPPPDSPVQEPNDQTQAMTYIAQRGESGPIKIGFSIDPEARAEQLSKQQPEKVRILATLEGRKHEKALHRRFSHIRIENTEWFEPHEDLLQFVQDVSSGRAVDGQWTSVEGESCPCRDQVQIPSLPDPDPGTDPDPSRGRRGALDRLFEPASQDPEVLAVWSDYREIFSQPNAELSRDRAEVIYERLHSGVTREQFRIVWKNALRDGWLRSKRWPVVTMIRNQDQFEALLYGSPEPAGGGVGPRPEDL